MLIEIKINIMNFENSESVCSLLCGSLARLILSLSLECSYLLRYILSIFTG